MLVSDMGVALLGEQTAKLVRTVALFPRGCHLNMAASILEWSQWDTSQEAARLMDTGLLYAPEVDSIAVNTCSVYWEGAARLLDVRTMLEQTIALIAESLSGPGTRVMLFGAAHIESAQFEPDRQLVLICAPDQTGQVSVQSEMHSLIEEMSHTTVIEFEDGVELREVLRTGDPVAIRRWLNADDIREAPLPDEGAVLIDAHREYLVKEGSEDASHRPTTTE